MKSTITGIKNSMEEFNNRFEQAEENPAKLKTG